MRVVVALLDRGHRPDVGLVAHRGQRTDRHFDGLGEVRRVHRLGDVQRTQVARNVFAHLGIRQVLVEQRRRGHLQDLRAQVGVGDLALDRVRPVHRVLEHDVRVARLELQLGQRLEELARLDLGLADPRVVDHLVVLLGDRDVGERNAVDALDVVRREQVHVLVVLGQLEGDVRDHHAQAQRLDPDLLVGVLPLGVQESVDVGVVGMQIHRAGALARAQLVGVGERVLEQLHDRDDARGLVFDVLDRCAVLANVGQQQRDSPAALGQLQRGVDRAADRLHVVFDAQQEAAHRLAALLLARVEEGRRGRLEPAVDDLVDQLLGQPGVTGGQRQRDHHDPVFEALQIPLAVESLQRVGGVVLERAEEGREPELLGIGAVQQRLDEVAGVLVENLTLVVVLLDQVVELLVLIVEEHRVLVDVLQEVLMRGFAVLLELDLAVGVVQIQHRVQRVVVRLIGQRVRAGGYRLCSDGCWHVCSFQKSARPARTASTSSGVPISSKR